jgi:hypothetical protein
MPPPQARRKAEGSREHASEAESDEDISGVSASIKARAGSNVRPASLKPTYAAGRLSPSIDQDADGPAGHDGLEAGVEVRLPKERNAIGTGIGASMPSVPRANSRAASPSRVKIAVPLPNACSSMRRAAVASPVSSAGAQLGCDHVAAASISPWPGAARIQQVRTRQGTCRAAAGRLSTSGAKLLATAAATASAPVGCGAGELQL